MVPILGIAQLSAWLHSWLGWNAPRVVVYARLYMTGEIQTVLAVLVGLALASATRRAEDAGSSRPSENHTERNASVGLNLAARTAGYSPAIAPITSAAPIPAPRPRFGTTTVQSCARA